MATITHKNLPNAQLHECKGASTAVSGQASLGTGSGTSIYRYINPIGSCSFINYASPYTLAFPSVYTKINATSVPGAAAIEVTEATTSRLTYTGALTSKFRVICNASVSQSSGSSRDIALAIYKNGAIVPMSEIFTTTSTAVLQLITSMAIISLGVNDYIEAYVKNLGGSGDVKIHSFYLDLVGVRG